MGLKVMITGFAIFAVGILLFVGYLPMVGESAVELSGDYDTGNFEDYSEGDHVTVYGTVTDVRLNNDKTIIVLDGQKAIPITVQGNITGFVREGQDIYVKCTVEDINAYFVKIEHLTAEPNDVHHKWGLDALFGLVAISGLVMATVAAVKKV